MKKIQINRLLFNQYIIGLMPQLFELVEKIEKIIKLPKNIQKLIEEKNINNDNERNINFKFPDFYTKISRSVGIS